MPENAVNLLPISVIVGALLSPLASAIAREHWRSPLKAVTIFLLCVAAAVVVSWQESTLDWTNYRLVFVVIMSAAIASFHGIWKPSGAADKISQVTG